MKLPSFTQAPGSLTQPHAEDTFADQAVNHDDVRRRAYEIHLERGGLSGRELADGLPSETERGKNARLL
jgi:hypothetical protein